MKKQMQVAKFDIDFTRSDYIIRIVCRLAPGHPILIAVLYSLISFGGTILIIYLWSFLYPPVSDHIPLSRDYANIINCGIVLPITVYLVLNLYSRSRVGFLQLIHDHIIVLDNDMARENFLHSIDKAANRKSRFYISIILGLATYSLLASQRCGYWNSGWGNPAVWWFRFFAAVNICMLFHLAYKCTVIVRAVRSCFSELDKIILQPLHPDGCGGLKSLGDISLAINYLVGIVAVYLSVIAFTGYSPLENPVYFVVVAFYCVLAGYLFYVPLANAHELMQSGKEKILSALNQEFQKTYTRVSVSLFREGIPLEDAQKIESLERLHRIASKMPVWPMDTRILGQFCGVIIIPLLVGLAIEYLKYYL